MCRYRYRYFHSGIETEVDDSHFMNYLFLPIYDLCLCDITILHHLVDIL